MSPVKSAVPAYLSRLVGRAPIAAPRLRPPRPLFPPAVGALTDVQSQAPSAALARRPGPVDPAPSHPVVLPGSRIDGEPRQGAGHWDRVSPSSAVESPANAVGERPGARPSGTPVADGSVLDRPLAAPALPAQQMPPGLARLATTETAPKSAAPIIATPITTALSTASAAAEPNGSHPVTVAPLAPPVATAVTPQPFAPPAPQEVSPDLPPVRVAMEQPAQSTRPGMGPDPAARIAESAAPAIAALVPPKAIPSPQVSHEPVLRRNAPVNAPASPAQLSIGTIEVIVEAATPSQPLPPAQHPQHLPPAQHPQPRPGAAERASADAAWRAARGAARRWFGAGQS